MKVLLSSLLLASLCALSSWSVPSATQVVTQTHDVSVMEGETVIITCCWRVEIERLTVTWLKHQSIKKEILLKNGSEGPQWSGRRNCSNLIFANITREDSGRYTCRVTVEIPVYNQLEGNGTVITVMRRDNPKNDSLRDEGPGAPGGPVPVPLIVSVAVAAALLFLTLVCFYTLRRRQVSVQVARVIYEVPHTDSEVADMDKHSTSSSRGSSQWCQVPVYESFDYFERVQTKESK